MTKKNIIKVIGFILVFVLSFEYVTSVFIVKDVTSNQEFFAFKDYYKTNTDGVDIVLLGSSNMVQGVSAAEMYETNGITAWNLGTGNQTMLGSYYVLKEACKKQDVKLVVLDMSMMYEDTTDAYKRRVFDNMKFSWNKIEGTWNLSKLENAESFFTYLFPIVQFHSRWNELNQVDFKPYSAQNKSCLGGILRSGYRPMKYNRVAVDNDTSKGPAKQVDYEIEYFKKIVSFCEENEIELLLIKTPKEDWNIDKYNATVAYAAEYNLPYVDFNTKEMLKTIDFNTKTDMNSKPHLNVYGVVKVSKYLAEYIAENYNMPDRRGEEVFSSAEMERYDLLKQAAIEELQFNLDNGFTATEK